MERGCGNQPAGLNAFVKTVERGILHCLAKAVEEKSRAAEAGGGAGTAYGKGVREERSLVGCEKIGSLDWQARKQGDQCCGFFRAC